MSDVGVWFNDRLDISRHQRGVRPEQVAKVGKCGAQVETSERERRSMRGAEDKARELPQTESSKKLQNSDRSVRESGGGGERVRERDRLRAGVRFHSCSGIWPEREHVP